MAARGSLEESTLDPNPLPVQRLAIASRVFKSRSASEWCPRVNAEGSRGNVHFAMVEDPDFVWLEFADDLRRVGGADELDCGKGAFEVGGYAALPLGVKMDEIGRAHV